VLPAPAFHHAIRQHLRDVHAAASDDILAGRQPREASMPMIFVDTDNADFQNKLFNGFKAGDAADKAEAKMQKVVETLIGKAPGFTTHKDKDAKGYAIRLTVAKVETGARNVTCSLSGEIVRFPLAVNKKGEQGEEMVSAGMAGKGVADGTSQAAVVDCIETVAQDLVNKAIPKMRADFAKR
jgi:hypothetical protein